MSMLDRPNLGKALISYPIQFKFKQAFENSHKNRQFPKNLLTQ